MFILTTTEKLNRYGMEVEIFFTLEDSTTFYTTDINNAFYFPSKLAAERMKKILLFQEDFPDFTICEMPCITPGAK